MLTTSEMLTTVIRVVTIATVRHVHRMTVDGPISLAIVCQAFKKFYFLNGSTACMDLHHAAYFSIT